MSSSETDMAYAGAYAGIRVLVLGASGFIGSRVTGALVSAGAEVTAVVRRESTLPVGPGLHVRSCDLSRLDDVADLVQQLRPAVTFNLAGYGVDRSETDEVVAQVINARLPDVLAASMAGAGDRTWSGQALVHVGSALEYGEAGGHLGEDTVPRPTTMYGRSKLAGTLAVAERCQRSGLKGFTARLFTVYGPGEHAGRLLPTLLTAAAVSKPVDLTAGTQLRDFTYIDDVVQGLLRLCLARDLSSGEVVNLATGRLTSVREFAERAAAALALEPLMLRFGAVASRPEEMSHLPVSIRRLRELVKWRPAVGIEEGVLRTAAEHRRSMDRPSADRTHG